MATRTFTDSPAVRKEVPLFVGLVGPSGSGKTYSALRLATGMQKITGGDIFCIDTEADRALHYSEQFKCRHVPFGAPFDPLSYLAAVEHCAKKGAKIIVLDSASHMHEGAGGTLEAHEAELTRLAGNDYAKRKRCTMLAWQKPKSELRRFLNSILQMRVNLIFCFRAKQKLKMERGQASGNKDDEERERVTPLGFQPIAGDEMFYEMALSCLLYPNSGGVPSWQPDEMGERAIIKLPGQFRDLFAKSKPLDEATGEALAKWAAGSSAVVPAGVLAGLQATPTAQGAVKSPGQTKAAWVMERLVASGVEPARALNHVNVQTVAELTSAHLEVLVSLGKRLAAGESVDKVFPVEAGWDG